MTLPVYPVIRGLANPVMKSADNNTAIQKTSDADEVRIAQYQNPEWHWTLIYEYVKNNPLDVLPQFAPYTDYQILQGFFLGQQGQFAEFLFDDPTDDTVGPALSTTAWQANYPYQLGNSILDPAFHWQQITTPGTSGATIPTFNDSGGTTADGSAVWTDRGAYTSAGFPNLAAQLQVVTDGAGNYYSPLQRNFGGYFYEDITDLNPQFTDGVYPYAGIAVYANGVLQTGPTSGPCATMGVKYQIYSPGNGDPQLTVGGHSYAGMYLKWCSGAPTAPVTAAFNFYFRVRFETDSQDFEQFLGQAWSYGQTNNPTGSIWTVGGEASRNGSGMLKLQSVRIPSV